MEFYGSIPTEERDEEFNNVFKINPLLSLPEADRKWEEGLNYIEKVDTRLKERYNNMLYTANYAQSHLKTPSYSEFLFAQSLDILNDTMALYIACSKKFYELHRRRVLYSLWNRPMSREDVILGERWSVEDVKNFKKGIKKTVESSQKMIRHFQEQLAMYATNQKILNREKLIIIVDKFVNFWRNEHTMRIREVDYYTQLIDELETSSHSNV